MEPPVSVPRARGAIPAATATALPPEDPPGVRVGSQVLRVTWKALFSVEEPIANSSMFVLPGSTAPASRIEVGLAGLRRAREDARSRGGRRVARAERVLDADGHARQRAERLAPD